MYICKECNSRYEVKPDYCNCGNDTFDYIEDKLTHVTKPTRRSLTLEEKSEIISRIFFVICLVLAISVWFIPMNNKPTTKQQPTTQPKVNNQNIPDITKIWNDTPIYTPKEQQVEVINKEPIKLTPTPVDYARRSN